VYLRVLPNVASVPAANGKNPAYTAPDGVDGGVRRQLCSLTDTLRGPLLCFNMSQSSNRHTGSADRPVVLALHDRCITEELGCYQLG
jgi:hypothetical protein